MRAIYFAFLNNIIRLLSNSEVEAISIALEIYTEENGYKNYCKYFRHSKVEHPAYSSYKTRRYTYRVKK